MTRQFAPLRRIVVGIDLARDESAVIERVVRLPLGGQAAVTLVHVLARDAARVAEEHAVARMRAIAASILARLPDSAVDVRMLRGAAAEQLARLAGHDDPDLVVVGRALDRDRLARTVLAPTGERVARRIRAPVLVVVAPPRSRYRTFLAAIESPTETSRRSVELALRLVEGDPAERHVLHAVDQAVERRMARGGAGRSATLTARRWLRSRVGAEISSWLAGLSGGTSPWRIHLARSDAGVAMLEMAQRIAADLLVMGADRRWIGRDLRLASVVGTVLRRTDRDVLVVSGTSEPARGRSTHAAS